MNKISPQSKTLAINILLGLLGLYLALSLFGTVRRNYELQREITQLEQSNKALEQSNQDLKYQIAYFQTDLFKDKAARAKLGLQAPGENVLILPKQPAPEVETASKQPKRSNFAQWIDFLRGISQ